MGSSTHTKKVPIKHTHEGPPSSCYARRCAISSTAPMSPRTEKEGQKQVAFFKPVDSYSRVESIVNTSMGGGVWLR